MTKQSANRHNKQRQGTGKPSNNGASSPAQTSAKLTKTEMKANGAVATKPDEATTKTNGTTPAKSTPMVVKSGSNGMIRPAQPGAGTLKRAEQRKQQKTHNRQEQQREDARSTRVTLFTIATVVVLVGSLIAFLVVRNNQASDPLAQAQTVVDANYQPIDGVYCDANEQLSYHIHAYLQIYIDGANVPLSQGIGIAPGTTPSCLYWLHTHDTSGVIHIESPTTRVYTLKQFFDIWQSFSSSTITYPTQLSSSTGWTIYVNGKQVTSDFSHLQLNAHDIITLGYNSPGIKPVTTYAWQGL